MNIKNKKIYISTLGCRVNSFETNQMQQLISENGAINCLNEKQADIAIVNTCCVTTKAMAKSRYFINRLSKCPKLKLIIVCGCYSQYKPEEIINNKVGIIIGTKYKTEIIDLIKKYDGTRIIKIDNILKEKQFEISNNTCEQEKTRGIIKIQDGCNFNCSYCIIPLVRGRQRSLSNKIIINDIKSLVNNGIKEVVLTGINTSGYNYEGISFFDLLKQIDKLDGNFRIRISSLEPFQVNHKIIDLITSNKERWCQTFHLCLQNANDEILREMARKYTMTQFYTLIKYIRLKSPLCSITTDYIVGFPTETIKNFDDSIKQLKKLALSDIHIFPFSSHKGTKASLLKNIVSDTEKKRRYMIIDALNKENMTIYLNKFIGKTVDVLFEKSSKLNLQYGHSQYFFSVNVRTKKILTNKMLKVKITSAKDNEIFGKLV